MYNNLQHYIKIFLKLINFKFISSTFFPNQKEDWTVLHYNSLSRQRDFWHSLTELQFPGKEHEWKKRERTPVTFNNDIRWPHSIAPLPFSTPSEGKHCAKCAYATGLLWVLWAPQTFPTAISVVCWHFTSPVSLLASSVTFLFTLIFIHEFVFHSMSYAYGNEQSTWGKN